MAKASDTQPTNAKPLRRARSTREHAAIALPAGLSLVQLRVTLAAVDLPARGTARDGAGPNGPAIPAMLPRESTSCEPGVSWMNVRSPWHAWSRNSAMTHFRSVGRHMPTTVRRVLVASQRRGVTIYANCTYKDESRAGRAGGVASILLWRLAVPGPLSTDDPYCPIRAYPLLWTIS
jgi:hypothetical protein